MRSHRKLQVWDRACDAMEAIYRVTAAFPRSEVFGISAQMRRAAVSVVSNIGEGAARRSDREFARFLDIAMGSAGELQAQLDAALRLGFGDPEALQDAERAVDEVKRMLAGLSRAVTRRMTRPET